MCKAYKSRTLESLTLVCANAKHPGAAGDVYVWRDCVYCIRSIQLQHAFFAMQHLYSKDYIILAMKLNIDLPIYDYYANMRKLEPYLIGFVARHIYRKHTSKLTHSHTKW